MNSGGLVEWSKQYRLRHLITNNYLALNKKKSSKGAKYLREEQEGAEEGLA